jgi:hypothetical protein
MLAYDPPLKLEVIMVAVTQPNPSVTLFGHRFEAKPNPNLKNEDGTPKTKWDHVVDALKTQNIAFRLLQLIEKVLRVVSLVADHVKTLGAPVVAYADALASRFATAWQIVATWPRLPSVTRKAWAIITRCVKPDPVAPADTDRENMQSLHDVAEAGAAWSYAGALVAGSMSVKNVADTFNLVADATELGLEAKNWSMAKRHIEALRQVDPNNTRGMEKTFVDTLHLAMIKIIKAASSVVNGVLALLALSLGGPILPPVAMVGIGLTSTTSAIAAHFFEQTVDSKVQSFTRVAPPPPVLVTAAAGA